MTEPGVGVAVKICGIRTEEALFAAIEAGAAFLGFVFHAESVRALSASQARELLPLVPKGVSSVGLFVDPSDDDLSAVLEAAPLSMIQLHGRESPARVHDIRARFSRPVIKALGIRAPADLADIAAYEDAADWLLFDYKPAEQDAPTGGTGHSFDWTLLMDRTFRKPWMLAGGLSPHNVGEAIKLLNPPAVDVSSGVESDPGIKDALKIKAFLDAVRL